MQQKMRVQVNTVIQSVNQARQTLGRKSDVGHTHETHLNDDLLATVNNEIAQVRQNVTALYKEVLEFKLSNLEVENNNKDEYSQLQNNVRMLTNKKYLRKLLSIINNQTFTLVAFKNCCFKKFSVFLF